MRNAEKSGGTADTAVIGGGIVGLAIARELGRRGVRVVVIERNRPGAEASGAAAGMLAPQAEADQRDEFFDLLCASRDLYPSYAERLLEETGIDIELEETGTLYLALTEEDEEEIDGRYEWQQRAGMRIERLAADEARAREANISPHVRRALRFPADVQVENRRLIAALCASCAETYGVQILPGTEAAALVVERGRVRGVETSRGFISANSIVVAAGAWSSSIPSAATAATASTAAAAALTTVAQAPFRIEPVRGQMLCFDARPPLVRHVVYTPRGYLVPRRDGRLLAGSTTEHAGFDKSVTGAGIYSIMHHALEIAPRLGDLALIDSWAGLRPRGRDGWPLLDESQEVRGLYYATGHYRNGILLAPLTGELMAEMIVSGRKSPPLEAFTLGRFNQDVHQLR